MNKHVWRDANPRLLPSAFLMVVSAVIGASFGNMHGNFNHKLVSIIGMLAFVVFAITFLHVLTSAIQKLIASHRLGVGRAASLQFILRVFGYITIILIALELVGISVEHLLLGGAVLGIILGVAAQQALANFFASIVLVISHPFTVGEHITLYSGALGKYVGVIHDIGLTHTRIKEDETGNIILLPNSTLLTGAALTPMKKNKNEGVTDDKAI